MHIYTCIQNTHTHRINPHKIFLKEKNNKKGIGQIKVGSEIWTAKSSSPILEGAKVIIKEIDGVKAIVEPILTPITK